MTATITKTALTVLLVSHKCTEPEFKLVQLCSPQGNTPGYCVYSSRNGKRFTLGLWDELNQHTTEQIEEKIERELTATRAG